jgi:hypothetical protein
MTAVGRYLVMMTTVGPKPNLGPFYVSSPPVGPNHDMGLSVYEPDALPMPWHEVLAVSRLLEVKPYSRLMLEIIPVPE